MKAWTVSDRSAWERGSTVVFAETRGKAHELALHTDCCEDSDWNDIQVVRNKAMDKMYRGKNEMDWYEPEDRITLVKECGWYCEDVDRECCEKCPAAEWCGNYQDWKEDMEAKDGIVEEAEEEV